jgi:hypothetical protein
MGGHHSKQSLKKSSDIVTKSVLNQSQGCIAVSDGKNVLNVFGNANVVENVDQGMSFTIKQDCKSVLASDDKFQSQLSTQIAQSLKDQDIALTSWLTPGTSDQSQALSDSVRKNISTDLVQNCLTQLSGTNVVNVQGSANVVQNVVQKQSQGVVASCMQGNQQSLSTMTDMTDIVNQNEAHSSKNPLAFITDAIGAAVSDVAVAVGIAFVAIVLIVVLGKIFSHRRNHHGAKRTSAPPMT